VKTTDTEFDPELHARRASSFGAHAEVYAQHRPDYPAAAVDWALDAVRARNPLRVLDLAAGTGKLTEALLRHEAEVEVIAVEPDAEMLAELQRRVPGVTALAGSAEDIPLPDGAVDAVLVGQAFHWFDQDRALPEIARVLRAEGVLCALWNYEDASVPWVAEFTEVARTSPGRMADQRRLQTHQAFAPFERVVFEHSQRRDADSLVATVGTRSHTLVVEERERAELLDRVRAYLLSRPETASGEFDLPMVTIAVRAVRS
jgi:ubiquinone/menaquinone biosynthesis C-methylase UbiE